MKSKKFYKLLLSKFDREIIINNCRNRLKPRNKLIFI